MPKNLKLRIRPRNTEAEALRFIYRNRTEKRMQYLPAILFDRDGTLIKDKHYLSDPEGVELLPGVGEALGRLAEQGVRLFLVSNQSGVGRGMFSIDDVHACNNRLVELLAPFGARLDDIVFCPHGPEEHCACRKPGTGMWEELRKRHRLFPDKCYMVGDKEDDMLFAANAGLAARVLVLTGKGKVTAEKLGIPIPSGPSVQVAHAPLSASHPHLCISGFSVLEKGLALLGSEKGEQWHA